MAKDILRHIEGDVEYFTVMATGNSGLSVSGIARSLGVSQPSITKILQKIKKTVIPETLPESLRCLVGKTLTLTTSGEYKNVSIYTCECWAALAEYYAFDALKPTKQARSVMRSINRIGAESYVQGKTGWLPNEKQSAAEEREKINRIMLKPNPWEKLYEVKMCDKIRKLFGMDCARFYWWYCYDFLTKDERDRLNTVNPIKRTVAKSGVTRIARPKKIHQYLDDATKARLRQFVEYLGWCIKFSDSRSEFEKKWAKEYGTPEQLELFDLWEFVD